MKSNGIFLFVEMFVLSTSRNLLQVVIVKGQSIILSGMPIKVQA